MDGKTTPSVSQKFGTALFTNPRFARFLSGREHGQGRPEPSPTGLLSVAFVGGEDRLHLQAVGSPADGGRRVVDATLAGEEEQKPATAPAAAEAGTELVSWALTAGELANMLLEKYEKVFDLYVRDSCGTLGYMFGAVCGQVWVASTRNSSSLIPHCH